jgi:hypothetical protein
MHKNAPITSDVATRKRVAVRVDVAFPVAEFCAIFIRQR